MIIMQHFYSILQNELHYIHIFPSFKYLLGALQIPVDDLVRVQVLHAVGDLLRPGHEPLGRNDVAALGQDRVQRPECTILHDHAKHGRLSAYTPVWLLVD